MAISEYLVITTHGCVSLNKSNLIVVKIKFSKKNNTISFWDGLDTFIFILYILLFKNRFKKKCRRRLNSVQNPFKNFNSHFEEMKNSSSAKFTETKVSECFFFPKKFMH